MAVKSTTDKISVWFDAEGDYLEVLFEEGDGYFKQTADDRVMVRVDMNERIVGFNVLGVSSITKPLEISLQPIDDEAAS